MTDENDGSAWVIEPPGDDAAQISIDVTNADLTPETRAAVEALVRALERYPSSEQQDVEGFRAAGFSCPKETACSPLSIRNCFAKSIIDCRVVPCPTYDILGQG